MLPTSPDEDGFMTFSELELAAFLHKNTHLQERLWTLIQQQEQWPDPPSLAPCPEKLSQESVTSHWLQGQQPGILIKHFIANVAKEGLTVRQRGKAGYAAAVKLLSLQQIEEHVNELRDKSFVPANYNKKGYVLRGSIKTDGHRLQLLAFKLKELQSVRYKRYKDALLPDRLQSTTGGTDYYLTEVRNVVKTDADVYRYWGCTRAEAGQISYLGIDLGQACVVGACALLPEGKTPKGRRRRKRGKTKRGKRKKGRRGSRRPKQGGKDHGTQQGGNQDKGDRLRFFNLAVKQKAVSQPTFKHRRWMEAQKNDPEQQPSTNNTEAATETSRPSISDIESALPPLHGQGASFAAYVQHRTAHRQTLDEFYNGNNFRYKKHKWDAKRARQEEFRRIADSLLRMVGGSIGARRNGEDKVIIGIGLGKFSSNSKLSSLHESFQTYFVKKV